VSRIAENIHHPSHPTAAIDQRTGFEAAQIKACFIQQNPGFGIRVEIDLKPPIEQKTFHHIGPHAPSRSIARFENPWPGTLVMESDGTRQSRQSATYDEDVFSRSAQ